MRSTEQEMIKAKAQEDLDDESGQALLGEDGLLGSGARLGCGLADGASLELVKLTEPGVDPSKKPAKPRLEPGAPVVELEPPTIKQEMATIASKIIKERGWRKAGQWKSFDTPSGALRSPYRSSKRAVP